MLASTKTCLRSAGVAALLAITAIPPGDAIGQSPAAPEYLDQGWSDRERDWVYSFSQGSQLMPYPWFRALELPDSETRFIADGLARYGYMPRARSDFNPDALPVGFAVDFDRTGAWIGMNCAACHTGRVEYRGRTLQIDGAPGNGDLHGLLAGLDAALQATLADAGKLDRFLARVRGDHGGLSDADITRKVRDFSVAFSGFVRNSASPTAWGPARTDAFGMIFNRATSIDLAIAENSRPPAAPVSYPFLWTTNQQDFIQWNGAVPNGRVWERLGRNVGQVLGVFGQMPNMSRTGVTLHRYDGSLHIPELLLVDHFTGTLRPPRWPGETDAARVARGRQLYQRCSGCHLDAVDGTSVVRTKRVPIAGGVNTDPLTVELIARTVKTGPLRNLVGARIYEPEEPAAKVLSKMVLFTLLELRNWGKAETPGTTSGDFLNATLAVVGDRKAEIREALARLLERVTADGEIDLYLAAAPGNAAAAYKAGPLNGIWATAPYLHNGSVPTLADLLRPAAERPRTFSVGSRRLDDRNVGFDSAEGSASFTLDTSQSGNGNQGHEGEAYGTTLTPEERLDLIEYLKTL